MRFGREGYETSPSCRVDGCGGSLTERTLMRIGVSNRHAILSLPTGCGRRRRGGRHFRQRTTGPMTGTSAESQAGRRERTAVYTPLEYGQGPRKGKQTDTVPGASLRIVLSETAATLCLG